MANVLGTLFKDIADAIRGKTGETGSMKPLEFPKKIIGIESSYEIREINNLLDEINGENVNGEIVTFIGADGSVLCKLSIAPSTDCPDPIAKGVIETPIKENTNTEIYTFSGWSLTEDGEADSEAALSNVTGPRIIYAVFTAETRYYTVRFRDGDKLLKTFTGIEYGGSASYTYNKTGARFLGWNPDPSVVTSDLDCYGAWEFISFASDSWEEIIAICRAGKAQEHYAIGDVKDLVVGNETIVVQIASFTRDTILGGEKASMTIIAKNPLKDSMMAFDTTYEIPAVGGMYELLNTTGFHDSDIDKYLKNTVWPKLPAALRDTYGIKDTKKDYSYYCGSAYGDIDSEGYFALWIPSLKELDSAAYDCYRNKDQAARIATLHDTGEAVPYWTRSIKNVNTYYVKADGTANIGTIISAEMPTCYVLFGFCI